MNALLKFLAFSILIKTHSVLSENPTCAIYDFNDPAILNEFDDCSALPGMSGSKPLVIESYSDSTFSPFRPGSQYYLTNDKSVNSDITQCLSTKALFRGDFSSFSFQIGIHLRNNNETDAYNNVQLFVSDILAFQISPGVNAWKLYEKNYSSYDYDPFDDSVVGLKVRIGSNSELAVEFIKFYDPEITDEYCVPLYATSPPESTTDTSETEATETVTSTPDTEAPTAETVSPTPETESPTPETESPTPETESPTPETESPTPETESPTPETESPTPETESPTTETESPTPETESPTPETDYPETEVPACLEVDFNKFTSLPDAFQECRGEYLPEFIIKSYGDTTITPYRETSLFYLSNKWEGLSCVETTSVFSLTESSFIETAIFLNGVSPGAWIEISIVDVSTGEKEVVKKLQPENNWIRLSEEIKGKYTNAQIFIRANMNAYSQLAMEYFSIRSESC